MKTGLCEKVVESPRKSDDARFWEQTYESDMSDCTHTF